MVDKELKANCFADHDMGAKEGKRCSE